MIRSVFIALASAVLLVAPAASAVAVPAASAGTLYVQQAESGTLTKSSGHWQLVLNGADRRTTSFSDRPVRRGGSLPLASFVSQWKKVFGNDAPNAALELSDAPAARDVALLELSAPRYSATRDQLTFAVKPLKTSSDQALGTLVKRADSGVHGSFGHASLFIDNGNEGNLLTISYSGIAVESVVEISLFGKEFAFSPAAAFTSGSPGVTWGAQPTIVQSTCSGPGGCSGSMTIAVDSSPTQSLRGWAVIPEGGGAVTGAWAGGATQTLAAPGGEFVLPPATP